MNLNEKILQMQTRSMKRNVILSGIEEQKHEDCEKLSKSFFSLKLGVDDIQVKLAHRLGRGSNRPLIVKLANVRQKSLIFGSVSKLKGLKNAQKKAFRVDDQLPEEINERKRHMFMHYKDAKVKNQADRMKMKRGILLVDELPYQKQIAPHDVRTQGNDCAFE